MKAVDLAYVAGLFDGEGCVCLATSGKTATGKQRIQLVVNLANTNEWITQWLKFNFGGQVYKDKISKRIVFRSDAWRWQLRSRQATLFLELILPYLKLKKPQAQLAIQFQSRQKIGRYQSDGKEILDEANRMLMRKYNRKGQR